MDISVPIRELPAVIALAQALFAGIIIAGVAVSQRDGPSSTAAVVGAGCVEEPCEDE